MVTDHRSLGSTHASERAPRTRRAEWLLLAVSTLVSLGLLELLLRAFAPLYPSIYQPDDVVLVRLVPGARKLTVRLPVNGGQRIVSHINSQGFRGEELQPLAAGLRVMVYGDSNVQAEFSELEATFAKQLEQRLRSGLAQNVQVINAGVVGDGPDQVSLRMRHDLTAFKPDLAVVVIFADNDFGDLIRNRIYRLDARGELELNRYRLPSDRSSWSSRMQRASHPSGLARLQLERYALRLYGLLRLKLRATGASAGGEWQSARTYVEDSLNANRRVFRETLSQAAESYPEDPFFDYYDADIALTPSSDSARYKTTLMEKVLLRIRDLAARSATPLVLLVLPSAIDACPHYDYEVDAQRYPQYDRERLSGLVEQMAERSGIAHLNLMAAFRADGAERYYFRGGDGHWNDAGQAKAAQLLAAYVERHQLLRGRARAGGT